MKNRIMPNRTNIKSILQYLVLCAGLMAFQAGAAPDLAENGLHLLKTGNHLTLPIQVTQGYVFVEGRIGERSGVFMFDTGTPFPFFINRQYVPLPAGKYFFTGHAGSGQALEMHAHENVGPIVLADQTLDGFGALNSADFGFITDMQNGGVRPDFLGMAGLPLFRDHEFVLDYAAATLEVFRIGESGDPMIAHIPPEDIVATLAFRYQTGALPVATLEVDGIPIEAAFDTGAPGDLELTAPTRLALEHAGRLKCNENDCSLNGLAYQGSALTSSVPRIKNGGKDSLKAGYNFLKHYRSVWNFRKQTITLIKPTTTGSP